MIASSFKIQVVHDKTGKIVEWAPGLNVEKDIVEELVERVRAKGVGVFRTEEHVTKDVREAIEELLYDLKRRV